MRARSFRRFGRSIVVRTEPLIKRYFRRAVIAFKIPVMQLVKEIPGPRNFTFPDQHFLEPRMAHYRADLLKHSVKDKVQRVRRHREVDEICREIEHIFKPVVGYTRPCLLYTSDAADE